MPVATRDQLKHKLDHLERCKIIEQVKEPTEWVNSMVCVSKKNGRVRICIDPTDLNKAIMREHYLMNSIDDVATRQQILYDIRRQYGLLPGQVSRRKC